MAWDDLDLLLVDTPPGTSDEHLALVNFLSGAGVTGAVLVSTPQEVGGLLMPDFSNHTLLLKTCHLAFIFVLTLFLDPAL